MTTSTNRQGAASAPRKILVVDDDPITLKALSLKLESKGYRVVTARDGSQALNAMRAEKPDLTLMDVNFPADMGGVEWNGFRLTEWLRRVDDDRNMPFIVISSSDRAEYKRRASDVGAAAFLPKTVNSDGLLACIDLALRKKAGSDAGKTTAAMKPGSLKIGIFAPSDAPSAPPKPEQPRNLPLGVI